MPHRLPPNLRSKIFVDPDGHWIWTGYVTKERDRKTLRYDLTDDARKRGPYKPTDTGDYPLHYKSFRKSEPRASYRGRSTPAVRVVMASILGVTVETLPPVRKLCREECCVNPDHHQCTALVIPQRLSLEDLIASGESSDLGPALLGDQLGGVIELPVFLAYQQWELTQDEEQ